MSAVRKDARELWPFLAGLLAGTAGAVLLKALLPRRAFDPRLVGRAGGDGVLPVVVVPGLLGSELHKPDGTRVWLNVGNAIGSHELGLPPNLPPSETRDDLLPGGLLGVHQALPRLFGFTEYGDLVDLLEEGGFQTAPNGAGPPAYLCTYDWRRDLVASARALHETMERLAQRGTPHFNVVGHSMGGLVARYYLRYGTAEPGGPVTWAGARYTRNLILVATPNAGSLPAFEALLFGERVGLSATTLSASVIRRMPSIYTLLPHPGTGALRNERGESLGIDLLDPDSWRRFSWGPFAPARRDEDSPNEEARDFFNAALLRARAIESALTQPLDTPCPIRVVLFGGDCLPTPAHALISDRPGARPRFQPRNRREAELMFEGGDGRVTRASTLASHLPGAEDSESGCGLPEVKSVFLGDADHHGIYKEVTFQSLILRLLLRRPAKKRLARPNPEADGVVRRGASE